MPVMMPCVVVIFDLPVRLPTTPTEYAVIAADPPWLGAFISAACNYASLDPAFLVPLLLRHSVPARQGSPEAACVIDRLRASQRWDEAYLVWLNTLPRERLADVGFVFNGSFEFAPSGFGFDWIPAKRPERLEKAGASGIAAT